MAVLSRNTPSSRYVVRPPRVDPPLTDNTQSAPNAHLAVAPGFPVWRPRISATVSDTAVSPA
jgi:hypothetical protein